MSGHQLAMIATKSVFPGVKATKTAKHARCVQQARPKVTIIDHVTERDGKKEGCSYRQNNYGMTKNC